MSFNIDGGAHLGYSWRPSFNMKLAVNYKAATVLYSLMSTASGVPGGTY